MGLFCKNNVSLRKTLKRLALDGRLAYAIEHGTGWEVIILPNRIELNQFDIEDFSLLTNAYFYPSITERGRIRLDFKIELKYDLPLDFYIKLGYTHNYDNQPVTGVSENIFKLDTTIGWEL